MDTAMKCPRRKKDCASQFLARAKHDNFICAGITSKPTYEGDCVRLCVKGAVTDKIIAEMTPQEAVAICAGLSCAVFNLKQ